MATLVDAWLLRAAARLHEQAGVLTALDQAIGDGDHGTNVDRGFTRRGCGHQRRAACVRVGRR